FFPLNEDFVEEQGEDYGTEADKILSNGAFILDSWEHDKGWTLKKNPDYWDADSVELDEVNVNVIKDKSTLVNLWETGELDRIELSSSYVDEYEDDDSFFVEEIPSNGAFILDSWEHDKGWTLKKNPDYWDADSVELDEVNVNVIKDKSTLVNLWETGELDRIELSSSYVDEYEDDDSFFVEERP